MGAKDEVRALVDGLSEEECQKLLAGVDVYGAGAFDLGIRAYVAAARIPVGGEGRLPTVEGDPFVRNVAEWTAQLERTDTPLLTAMKKGTRSFGRGKG